MLWGALGVGAVFGAVLVNQLRSVPQRPLLIAFIGLWAICPIVFALVGNLLLALIVFGLGGLAAGVRSWGDNPAVQDSAHEICVVDLQ